MTTSATDAPVIDAHELTVRYGTLTAVDGVTLQASAGEILGLLGPNGAGKTSMIRALTAIHPIAGGHARILGQPLTDPRSIRARIGVLPESSGYPSAPSARSYLRFHGQLHGLPRAEADRRAERLLSQLSLAGNHRPIGGFSRGMRQRLGLARALINDPAVLFLDEPTLGLDPAGKEEILDHLTRAATDQGTCVVLCSHLLDEVERVCDRVAIMHHARIVATGTVAEIVAAAGMSGRGLIRVAPADVAAADTVLRASLPAGSIHWDTTRPGDLEIRIPTPGDALRAVVRSLLDAGVELRACDLTGGRLSDAFHALTTSPKQGIR